MVASGQLAHPTWQSKVLKADEPSGLWGRGAFVLMICPQESCRDSFVLTLTEEILLWLASGRRAVESTSQWDYTEFVVKPDLAPSSSSSGWGPGDGFSKSSAFTDCVLPKAEPRGLSSNTKNVPGCSYSTKHMICLLLWKKKKKMQWNTCGFLFSVRTMTQTRGT